MTHVTYFLDYSAWNHWWKGPTIPTYFRRACSLASDWTHKLCRLIEFLSQSCVLPPERHLESGLLIDEEDWPWHLCPGNLGCHLERLLSNNYLQPGPTLAEQNHHLKYFPSSPQMRILVLQERTGPYFIQKWICHPPFISSASTLDHKACDSGVLLKDSDSPIFTDLQWPFGVHAQWSTRAFHCLHLKCYSSLLAPTPTHLHKSPRLPPVLSPCSQPPSHCSGLSLHYLLNEPLLIYQALDPIHLPVTYSPAPGDQIDGYLFLNPRAKTWRESMLPLLPHCLTVFLTCLSSAFVISTRDRCEICMCIPIAPRLFRFWKTLNAQRCL